AQRRLRRDEVARRLLAEIAGAAVGRGLGRESRADSTRPQGPAAARRRREGRSDRAHPARHRSDLHARGGAHCRSQRLPCRPDRAGPASPRRVEMTMPRLVLSLLLGSAAVAALVAQPARTVIAVGVLFDGRGQVIRDTRVVIEGSKIVAIDADASPIDYDLRPATMTPGWIDTHVHLNWHFDENHKSVAGGEPVEKAALYTAEDARRTLEAGFTTVQSVGAAVDGTVRDRIRDGLLIGPRVLTSLRQIQNRAGEPDQIRALIRQTKAEGADVIKLF